MMSVAVVLALMGARQGLWPGSGSSQTLSADRVTLSPVTQGLFDDVIPLRGLAAPLQTVYLDAIEGGRVERKWVEDGALLTAGQPIAQLSNSSLQLELIRSETEVTQQLTTLRSLELQIERNRADNTRLLAEIRWQLKKAGDKAERDKRLVAEGFLSTSAAQDSAEEQQFLQSRLAISESAQRRDEALQQSQIEQLRATTRQLQANLLLARSNLDALTVRAPIAGQLTAFDLTVGQSLGRGQRIGQIDQAARSKLVALIDEHFLPRVAVGQTAQLDAAGKTWPMQVRRLNPQVKAGQFEAELVFSGGQPEGLKRGQSLQARLSLGDSRPALLLPAGAFLADNAGSFVFVVEGERGTKRTVTLGQRNLQAVEVLAGLRAGEQVLTSSYAGLVDKDSILIRR